MPVISGFKVNPSVGAPGRGVRHLPCLLVHTPEGVHADFPIVGREVAERFKVLIRDGNNREGEIGLLKLHGYAFGLAALWALTQHQRCRLRLDRLGNQHVYAVLV